MDLPELRASSCPTGGTALFGAVQDWADIETLRARLVSLGLSVVQIRRLPDREREVPRAEADAVPGPDRCGDVVDEGDQVLPTTTPDRRDTRCESSRLLSSYPRPVRRTEARAHDAPPGPATTGS